VIFVSASLKQAIAVSRDASDSESNYSLEVIPGTSIALYRWSGPITVADRRNVRGALIRFCRDNQIRNLIVDGREQQCEADTTDVFRYGAEVPEHFRGLRIAVVHRPDDDSLPFIETVAYNRGSNTRSFLSVEEARAWLESFDDSEDTTDNG